MLEKVAIFASLSSDEIEKIVAYTTRRKYAKNTVIVTEGDTNQSLYVIVSGRAKVFVTDSEGREMILRLLGPGESFGELALLDDAPRSASVMTTEPTELLILSRPDFERCVLDHPRAAVGIIRALTARIRSLTDDVRALGLLDVYGRISKTLVQLAEDRDGKLVITQRLTHQDIASMVGSSREMVTRILKELTVGGYLTVGSGQITINKRLPAGR